MRKPNLKKGDRVVCLNMKGETSVIFGDWGTVTSVNNVMGVIQYGVDWDNGSKLGLLSNTDIWDTKLPEKKNRLVENVNPKLSSGDKVILIHMEGETDVLPGTWGTVTSEYILAGKKQYGVDWDNGSKLALLSDVDIWDTKLPEKKNRLTEDDKNDFFMRNLDVFKYFNMKFFKKYLLMIRDSSITNMLGASLYLYTGRERIEHEFKYKEISNEEAFEEVLENADRAQSEMINGVILYLEDKNIEESMENVNKYVHRFASKIAHTYIYL